MLFVFLFFHRLSAGSFIYLNDGSGNFGNLNVNGGCIVRFFFFFGYDCILLFDCRDTREGMFVCFKKILLVSSFLSLLLCFLLVFPGYQSDDRVLIRHS